MLLSLTVVLGVALVPQDPDDGAAPTSPYTSTNAEALRERIHGMRMNLLLGGDRVRQAEGQAVEFYSSKAGIIDQRLDSNSAELSEKRASYDLALERSLKAKALDGRQKAMGEASALRAQITGLEVEASDLSGKRKRLGELIQTVESRDRQRERLVAQLETASDFDGGMGFPMTSIGLAPVVEASLATSPLDDDELVRDLLERDPRGARRILFEGDPIRYWQRFPLRPPAADLRKAFQFPLPDLPGAR